ncbi:MAG: ATP-binding protein [Prevotellaceae bacterium]|jgi:predicted AAA+ superfamily ATPase|nr:ATP-binding protein [Prevotellaceae bacterium]
MYIKRTLSKIIQEATATFPVVLITGPRQVGKTTVFEHCKESSRTYITLDDPHTRMLAKSDPHLFFQTYKAPLFIDEIQYAPELFPYIKIEVDRTRQKGMFWLTGSQQFNLMQGVSESLAGRVAILELQGLSQSEKNGMESVPFLPDVLTHDNSLALDVHSLYDNILRGSFPELYANPAINRMLFYSSYLKTYIERDIRQLIQISDELRFITFVKAAAARTGQLINYNDMAKDVEVSVNTIKSWISILETSGLIFLLSPYHNNIANRALKTPKLYFADTGLCCYLSGWETVETLSNGAMSGAMLETYVISEIMKSYRHNGLTPNVWFYRDRDKKEIDLLIERNGLFYPVEIKRTASPKTSDVKHFSILARLGLATGKGAIVCLYDKLLPLNSQTIVVPVGYL